MGTTNVASDGEKLITFHSVRLLAANFNTAFTMNLHTLESKCLAFLKMSTLALPILFASFAHFQSLITFPANFLKSKSYGVALKAKCVWLQAFSYLFKSQGACPTQKLPWVILASFFTCRTYSTAYLKAKRTSCVSLLCHRAFEMFSELSSTRFPL